jgi:hypothetical protein
MMCAIAAAAGGQRGFVFVERGRERSQSEEEDKQNGESAPHLALILHEPWSDPRFGEASSRQVSSKHLEFPLPERKVECYLN